MQGNTPLRLQHHDPAERTGWDLLMFSYKVAWPLTLVMAPKQLTQYQLIFKLIFNLKHVERQLATTWHRMQLTRTVTVAM